MNDFCLQSGSRFEGASRRYSSTKTSLEYISYGTEGFSGVVALTIDG